MTGRVLVVDDVAGVAVVLARLLTDRGLEVRCVQAPQRGEDRRTGFEPLGGHRPGIAKKMAETVALRRLVRRWRPDVVHLHWASNAYLLRGCGRPLVVHAHGDDVRARVGLRRVIARAGLAGAVVLCSTPDIVDDAAALAGRPPRWLPNPLDPAVPAPDPAAAGRDGELFVFARAIESKGVDRIASILGEVRRRRPATVVTAVAHGERFDVLAPLVDRAVPEMPRVALWQLVAGHRVVLGQQRVGALGLSEVEAMAMALPVAAAVGAHPAAVRPPVLDGTVDAVAGGLVALLDDPAAARRAGEEGRTWASRHHAPQAVASELLAVYDDLLTTTATASRRTPELLRRHR